MLAGTGEDRYRLSNVAGCVERAALFGVKRSEALEIVDRQLGVIRDAWDDA